VAPFDCLYVLEELIDRVFIVGQVIEFQASGSVDPLFSSFFFFAEEHVYFEFAKR
jgi:hypothetical protein